MKKMHNKGITPTFIPVGETSEILSKEENSHLKKSRNPSLKTILKFAKDMGVSGLKIILLVLFAYGITNTIVIIYTLVRFLSIDYTWTNFYVVLFMLFISFCFTALACFLTYRYVIALLIWKVYEATLEERISISQAIVRQVTELFSGQKTIEEGQLNNMLNWSRLVYTHYQAVPVFLQSGITQLFNKIPIAKFIIELKDDILLGNSRLAAEKLQEQISNFFGGNLIGKPSNRLTWWFLILNAALSYELATRLIAAD
ncbi:hypothetical protein [Sphingobacterium deserti]|uniref:Uncharacterized protein n=1 Tax=Sphingobacterium deserti TaxID=1229276 RepID=A0A0B8T8X8_9SPHI|nr:hypothetical protein [Sphingobacterium deserti]KGE15134.1 hypothetical protein DI53_1132 [Sphingobacterium deserti]